MTDSELDAIYTHLCKTMTELGEAGALLFLARFALLAIDRLHDGEMAIQLVEAAAEDLAIQPKYGLPIDGLGISAALQYPRAGSTTFSSASPASKRSI